MFDFPNVHEIKQMGSKHNGTVIIFHGSGMNGKVMKEWVSILSKFTFPHLKVIYPTAPLQPYTPKGGKNSNVWFDRADVRPDVPELIDSVNKMEHPVRQLIKAENDAGVATERIIVGGFSMGGALSFHIGYRWERAVAGVFAFSSFLNDNSQVYDELTKSSDSKKAPLFQVHGEEDDVVLCDWGRATLGKLQALGVKGSLHTEPELDHQLNRDGLAKIRDWVLEILPEKTK